LNINLKNHRFKNQQHVDDIISESYASFAHYLDNKIDDKYRRPKPTELLEKMISVVTK
jgi:hypothetical protein